MVRETVRMGGAHRRDSSGRQATEPAATVAVAPTGGVESISLGGLGPVHNMASRPIGGRVQPCQLPLRQPGVTESTGFDLGKGLPAPGGM